MKKKISKKQRTTIAEKITKSSMKYVFVISLVLSQIMLFCYFNIKYNEFRDQAYNIAGYAAECLDADSVEKYANASPDTFEKDDYYCEVDEKLHKIYENFNPDLLWVFSPREEDLFVIWDTQPNGYSLTTVDYSDLSKTDLRLIEKDIASEEVSEKLSLVYYPPIYIFGVAGYPVRNSNGELVAIVEVDVDMTHVLVLALASIIGIISFVFVFAYIAGMVLSMKTDRTIGEPIRNFSIVAKEMVEDLDKDEDLAIECDTGDEIEDMADSFMTMNRMIKEYIGTVSQMTAEKERIETELNVATKIQSSMLPVDFPDNEYYRVYATMTPAKEVGGDFYDFFMVDRTHLAVVIADVSGKGVPAALFMVIAKTIIKNNLINAKEVGAAITKANHQLSESNGESYFVTTFAGVLDLVTGEFSFVNAGHEPLYIKKKNGKFEQPKLPSTLVLAIMGDMKYTASSIMLEPGDRIFQYTDGVTEAADVSFKRFEFERLTKSLEIHGDNEPKDLLGNVKKDVDEFVNGVPQFDDITMLCMDYKKRMKVQDNE